MLCLRHFKCWTVWLGIPGKARRSEVGRYSIDCAPTISQETNRVRPSYAVQCVGPRTNYKDFNLEHRSEPFHRFICTKI